MTNHRAVWSALRAAAVSALCVSVVPSARAQLAEIEPDKSGLLRRALVTDKEAYVLMPAEMVCGPRVVYLEPSVSRTHALIVRRAFSAERQIDALLSGDRNTSQDDDLWSLLQAGRADLEILLWGPTSRRALTLWRRTGDTSGYADITEVDWLGATNVALLKVELIQGPITRESLSSENRFKPGAPKRTYALLRVNAATGNVETVMTSEEAIWLATADDAPVAAVSLPGKKLTFVRETGTPSAPVTPPLRPGEDVFWSFWLRGGKELSGRATTYSKEAGVSSREVIYNITTGALRERTASDKVLLAIGDGRQNLPIDIEPQAARLENKEGSAAVESLWLGQREWKPGLGASPTTLTHRTLLAADADPQTKSVLLAHAALYQQQGTLWATPLVKVDRERFLAVRRERFKRDTLAQAARLGEQAAIELKYGQGDLPLPDKAAWSITFFNRIQRFLLNPETGKPGFKPLYTSVERSSYPNPKTARFGALAGPGGQAIIFWDGHVVWEDDAPKP